MTESSAAAAASEPPLHLERSIPLSGAVFTLIGYIIGGSIFILPGELAAQAGPGVFLAYLLSSGIALFVCVIAAQIGNAFPVSGANYVAVSTVLSPFWGFLVAWMSLIAVTLALPPLALGFADYLALFVPAVAEVRLAVAIGAVLLMTGVNLFGVRGAVWMQSAMVLLFMTVLLVFGLGGLANVSRENLTPFLPMGFGAVLAAAVPAYYSYAGFFVLTSIAGEVKNPKRNIPLALAAGFILILVTYQAVTIAVPGLIPWQELEDTQAAVARASEVFLPAGMSQVVAFGALLAIATSINGLILAKSRDLFALARDRVLPRPLAYVSPRFGSPNGALVFVSLIALVALMFQRSFSEYAFMSVLCIMVGQIIAGIAVIVLPNRGRPYYERAAFRLEGFWRLFWSAGLIIGSGFFIAVGIRESLSAATLFVGICTVGGLLYWERRRELRAQGVEISDLIRKDLSFLLDDDVFEDGGGGGHSGTGKNDNDAAKR